MLGFLKRKSLSAAEAIGAVIIGLQIILPTFLDLLTGFILMGLIWFASRYGGRDGKPRH